MVYNFNSLIPAIEVEFSGFDSDEFSTNPKYYYFFGAENLRNCENEAIKSAAEFILNNNDKISQKFNANLEVVKKTNLLSLESKHNAFIIAGQHPLQVNENGVQTINLEQKSRVDAAFEKIKEVLSEHPDSKFTIVGTGGFICDDTGVNPNFEEPQESLASLTLDYIFSIAEYKSLVESGVVHVIADEFMSLVMPFSVFGSADECYHYSKFLKESGKSFNKIFVSCGVGQAMRYFLLSVNNGFIPKFVIPESIGQTHHSISGDFVAISQIFEQMLCVGGDPTATSLAKFNFAMGSRIRRATKHDLEEFLKNCEFRTVFERHITILKRITEGFEVDSFGFYNIFRSDSSSVQARLKMLLDLAG